MTIKIALTTDDGESISQHFGQASYFKVITLEDNLISGSELREKASHQHGDHSHADGVHPGQQMVESIFDCQVLITGGMGTPALNRAAAAGLKVFLTDIPSIDSAIQAYVAGTLDNDQSRIHSH
jgi:predicted Fe-Mo cluster-binding NifX family protein